MKVKESELFFFCGFQANVPSCILCLAINSHLLNTISLLNSLFKHGPLHLQKVLRGLR